MKKKKGFTLIELIAAMAILSIAMVSISSAVCATANISAKNSKKVDTSVFVQNIIQTYKSLGKNYINSSYSYASGYYCYFNNAGDLNDKLNEELDDRRTNGHCFIEGNEQQMIDGNEENKKFGAYIQFQKVDVQPESGFYNIRMYVNVVNFNDANNNNSSLVFYLSR